MKITALILISLIPIQSWASNFEDFMAPPELTIEGRSISEYPNMWWEWAYSTPKEVNPVRDITGENCHQGQKGDVWFLAGGFGSSNIKRKCEVPSGKYIFFPVINMVYWKPQSGNLPCEKAKEYAALNNEELISIDVELDSKKSSNPAHTRMSSPQCFNIFARASDAYNAYPSATDGYWVMLKPLSKGKHVLKFQARYNRENGAFGKMAQDIEYELIIN